MLHQVNKNTVKAKIRKEGKWSGYISGNNVNSMHIISGWHLGMKVEVESIEQLNEIEVSFLWYLDSELGKRARYWEV